MQDAIVQPIRLKERWYGKVVLKLSHTVCGDASTNGFAPESWDAVLTTVVTTPSALSNRIDLKRSSFGEVFQATIQIGDLSKEVVCRHSRARGAIDRVVRKIKGSRESRNWSRAFELLRAGINTAHPLALLECDSRNREAWLITEVVSEAIDLDAVLSWHLWHLDSADFLKTKQAIIRRLVELCVNMERSGLYHRDFKASNILVTDWRNAAAHLRLWLVDLDGIRNEFGVRPSAPWRTITRMAASLIENPSLTRTDFARFLKEYLSFNSNRSIDRKTAWKRLAEMVQRYNRRSRGRKRGKLDGFAD